MTALIRGAPVRPAFFWLVLGCAGLASAQVTPPPADVVATVNGERLYFEDVERQLRTIHDGQADVQRAAFDLEQLMFRVVSDTLLAQEARALGMHEEDPIPRRLQERREEMARQRLETEEIWSRVEITDEEVREEFLRAYERVTFGLMTAEERADAERLRAQLDEGADFDELDARFQAELPGFQYRVLESVARANVPSDIEEVAFDLEPSEIGGPFRTNLGWSIVEVLSFEPASGEDFPKLENRIRDAARFRRGDGLRRELARRLRDSFEVTVDAEAADVGCERLPDGRLMPEVERPEAIVAVAGGRAVTAEAFGTALRSRWRRVRNREAALAARPLILERLIDHELMTAEALRRGYGETPEVERAVGAYLTELLVPRYLNEVLARSVEVSAEEKKTYYEEHRDEFRRLPRIKLGQVTVASQEEGERVAEMLRQKADLAWVARNHSIDQFKDSGGDRGWIVPTLALGTLQKPLAEAEPGTVLGPFLDDDGFVVLRVDAREDQGHYTLDEVSGNVRQAVFAEKFRQVLHEVITELRSTSEIVIHEETLAGMQLSGSQTTPKGGHPRMTGDGSESNGGSWE